VELLIIVLLVLIPQAARFPIIMSVNQRTFRSIPRQFVLSDYEFFPANSRSLADVSLRVIPDPLPIGLV